MIAEPTVFILGAGASAPYDFPVGHKLVSSITSGLAAENGEFAVDIRRAFPELPPPALGELRHTLLTVKPQSIDEFLLHYPDLAMAGKAAIARALIPFERPGDIHHDFDRKPQTRWYRYLAECLLTARVFEHNLLSIITFNYDRSLEYALYGDFQRLRNKTPAQAAGMLAHIPIVHLHGTLGRPEFVKGDSPTRPYTPDVVTGGLRLAAESIRLVQEVDCQIGPFALASTLLLNAKRVCILGYGFGESNCTNLRLADLCRRTDIELLATVHKVETGRRLALAQRFKQVTWMPPEHDVMTFLEHVVFLHG